ncbi:probable disease resistance protein At4g27220 isoform X1 [Durio zibethinus]|uniref:Probable disease resistance protein At4g27220 isoform X1 n=1 Tax=Durio zibethinus TaxID=66656 RepID=A0A6P5Z460_DURZI|nr:probable disease resistance protein At4g27220 isoform X1 [Durio zibethinus]XP_022747137.1 probable disease resistance protein At4g27220 isoform X1 [Durio zibethinus]XP_022747138.1 probable disease resistance protein At4g27220 isoform X1 [Durio zibethinus]XP_022747139.1 probable disease resistance protein At4g27220 isoform X1 [Durio zibethinus]
MEACISIVGSILGSLTRKAAEYTVDPIARQVSYLFKHKSKFQNLRDQLQKLNDARQRVKEAVNAANRQGEEIFDDVNSWLTKVNGICDEAAAQLDGDERKAKQRCFVGFCPNFKSRYQLSRKAEKEANTIAELLKDKDRLDGVSYKPASEGTATRAVKEYEAFESRKGVLDAVMTALKDANLSIIGVYGMGGLGKTTLVKQVARQAKDENLFDEVVLTAVTQSYDIKEIQDRIADELGLTFEKQSDTGRAGKLRDRLKRIRKVLVILDDIWVKLDMEALGIPYEGEHQGCKILLTSREQDALSLMGSLNNISIQILKEEEAWNLFKKKAGDIVQRPDLHATAIEVAKECAGLPIAIVTVGEAMKNKKNLSDWKYALNELRNPSKRNFKGIPAGAYSAIELSYKFLEDEEHQPTFLLCSIMGHDAAIEDLLKSGIGLGLFHGVNTIEETRYKVSALVSNLKRSSLLLDGSTFERFDMHDVVRDVAISIASRDHHWLARDDEFKELSNEETMRNCELICLQYAKVCELPDHDQLDCPKLTFFSLDSEDSSLKISDNFFRGMQKLRVLDFAKMYFPSLPLSFCFLKNLRTLCFSACMLKDIVVIGELKNLEILSLRKSKIAVLPGEIGQLIKLKLLDLSHCYKLKVISPNVLSRLSKLEELCLLSSFDRWEVEGHEKPRTNASLVELQHLPHLTTLEVEIPIVQAMPKELFSAKLERYRISIGGKWWRNYKPETSRELNLKLNKSIHLDDSGVKTLLRKTETLLLDAVKDAMDMLCDPDTEGFPHLKHLGVSNDSEVKYLINSMELASCKAFPLLETLSLFKLNNLEAIYYGQLQAECFGQLRKIGARDCNMLKNLFSFALARKLGHLEEIDVSNCENFTELIVEKREEEIGDDDILEFSQVRSLTLENLPCFIGLFNSEKKLSSSQQGRVQSIDGNSTATSLFDRKVMFPCLKKLWLACITVEKLWHDQLPVTPFSVENLTELTIQNCHNLKNLFTSSMVESFVQLKSLLIGNCNEIEEVITMTEGLLEEERMRKMVFPKLDNLHLWNLPHLKRFCFGNPNEFLSLRERRIVECPVLNTFHSDSTRVGTIVGNEAGKSSISTVNSCTDVPKYLFNEKVVFQGLEDLYLSSIAVNKLWHEQLSVTFFGVQNLTKLGVYECHNLKNIFTSSVESFVQLKTLAVGECNEIEEIIIVTEGLVEEERMRKMVFPKLDHLKLRDLPKLKRFGFGNPIEFPSLTYLHIEGCPVLNTVHSDSTSVGTIVGNEAGKSSISMKNLHTDVSKYIFNEKLAFPNLQQLHLGWDDGMKERLDGLRLAPDCFCKLKVLGLVRFPQQLAIFPSYLFQLLSLPNLESLQIAGCYFEELVFQSEGVGGEEKPASASMVLSRLTELWLSNLHELMHLWKEKEGFQNLRILRVGWCPILRSNLVPSSVCFQNLMTLEVYKCDGIIKLVTHSTAKSLVQLREMRIIGCRKIEEIIEGSDGNRDEVKDEIIFPKLNLLELIGLSNLESFCSSANHTFVFPSLATVFVQDCPKIKTFAQGGLNAPMLHKVRPDRWADEREDWIWEGSLNSTIQKLFKEWNPVEEMQNSVEDQGNPSTFNTQST